MKGTGYVTEKDMEMICDTKNLKLGEVASKVYTRLCHPRKGHLRTQSCPPKLQPDTKASWKKVLK